MNPVKEEKRKLTKKEIDIILSTLKPKVNTETAIQCSENNKQIVRKQLSSIEIYPSMIKPLAQTIYKKYNRALAEHGEMVGIQAASSIGEPTTQSTLNTFHQAGQSSKVTNMGVPRLQEIMDASKKPKTPSCLLFLKDDVIDKYSSLIKKNPDNKEYKLKCLDRLESYRKYIVHTKIKDILEKKELKYVLGENLTKKQIKHPLGLISYNEYKEPWWSSLSKEIYGESEIAKDMWIIELTFKLEELYKYQLTLVEIAKIIENTESFSSSNSKRKKKVICNFGTSTSPLEYGIIEVYIDYNLVISDDSSKLKFDDESDYELINESNLNYFYARDIVLPIILNIPVCGIEGISKIYPNEYNGKWGIDTQGANFSKLLKLPFIDFKSLYCDDFWQVYNILGIEAARDILFEELRKALSFEAFINPRHIELLADSMTKTGVITSVRREGIKRTEVGPISKSAFEKIVENFTIAGVFAEQENIKSVSSRITMGRMANIGTNVSKICIPINKQEDVISKEKIIKQRKAFDILNLNKKSDDLIEKFYSLLEKVKLNRPLKITEVADMETSYYITIDCGSNHKDEIPEKNISTYITLLKKQPDIERVNIVEKNNRKKIVIIEVIKKFDMDMEEEENDDENDENEENKENDESKQAKIQLIESDVEESEEDIGEDEDYYDDDD